MKDADEMAQIFGDEPQQTLNDFKQQIRNSKYFELVKTGFIPVADMEYNCEGQMVDTPLNANGHSVV